MHFTNRLTPVVLLLLLTACASAPENASNVCSMFEDRHSWFRAAKKAEERWGVPMEVNMAFVYQESSFIQRARPPRRYLFGFIPWFRPSNAFGYAQALDSTWDEYKTDAGGWTARRTSFADAIDFIGWYNDNSNRISGIDKRDAYNLYLAYHEGNGGWQRRSYAGNEQLLRVASNVQANADRYQTQLQGCRRELDRPWILRVLF